MIWNCDDTNIITAEKTLNGHKIKIWTPDGFLNHEFNVIICFISTWSQPASSVKVQELMIN